MTPHPDAPDGTRATPPPEVPWWYPGMLRGLIDYMLKVCPECGQPAGFHDEGECPPEEERTWQR